jgi:hypothetical protein
LSSPQRMGADLTMTQPGTVPPGSRNAGPRAQVLLTA